MLKFIAALVFLISFSAFADSQIISAKVIQELNIGTEKKPEKAILLQVRVREETDRSIKSVYRTYLIKQNGTAFDLTNTTDPKLSVELRIQSVMNKGTKSLVKPAFIAHIKVVKVGRTKHSTKIQTILINADKTIEILN